MDKNFEVIEGEEMEMEETEVVLFTDKVKTGIKKHGKKIAALAAVGCVGILGYALGKRKDDNEFDNVDGTHEDYVTFEIEEHTETETE